MLIYQKFVFQVIAAAGAVKHENIVEQVKKLFTKLSTDSTSTSQLVDKEPANFTGSEVKRTNISDLCLCFRGISSI